MSGDAVFGWERGPEFARARVDVDFSTVRPGTDPGGVEFELRLYEANEPRRDAPHGSEPGAKYRTSLAEPVVLRLRLDLAGVLGLAVKAARARGGRAKSGPLQVRGGLRAKWVRREGWGEGTAP